MKKMNKRYFVKILRASNGVIVWPRVYGSHAHGMYQIWAKSDSCHFNLHFLGCLFENNPSRTCETIQFLHILIQDDNILEHIYIVLDLLFNSHFPVHLSAVRFIFVCVWFKHLFKNLCKHSYNFRQNTTL